MALLLVAILFLFITAEVWQVAGTINDTNLAAVLSLFLALGILFIVTRLPRELAALARFRSSSEIAALLEGTPATGLPCPPPEDIPQLTRRQWGNTGLVVLVTQALRVTFAAVLVGLFFVAFGILTMRPEIVETWTTEPARILATFTLFGNDVTITEELLRVAVVLAGFSALYFTIYVVTDATFRREFFEDVEGELRQAFAVRAAYTTRRD